MLSNCIDFLCRAVVRKEEGKKGKKGKKDIYDRLSNPLPLCNEADSFEKLHPWFLKKKNHDVVYSLISFTVPSYNICEMDLHV